MKFQASAVKLEVAISQEAETADQGQSVTLVKEWKLFRSYTQPACDSHNQAKDYVHNTGDIVNPYVFSLFLIMFVFKTVEVSSFKFGTVIAAVESLLCKSASVSLDWCHAHGRMKKKEKEKSCQYFWFCCQYFWF